MIDLISKCYKGNIKLLAPLLKSNVTIPEALLDLLYKSNGIKEIMYIPTLGEKIEIGWIIYPLEMIIDETEFFKKEYSLDGTVFSDDGAGNPFYIKYDGKIYFYDCAINEEVFKADSLYNFYKK